MVGGFGVVVVLEVVLMGFGVLKKVVMLLLVFGFFVLLFEVRGVFLCLRLVVMVVMMGV